MRDMERKVIAGETFDEERALYWTFFDMRDGVIASIRNDPQG